MMPIRVALPMRIANDIHQTCARYCSSDPRLRKATTILRHGDDASKRILDIW